MHWSTCCSKAYVSTPDDRGHSWPLSAVGKVYRYFTVDHITCHAFLYACTQIFCRTSNSLCNHSMRAAKNWKAPIPFCAKCSAESSDVSGWLLIRSRGNLTFSQSTLPVLWRSCHHFPCPSKLEPGYRHVSLMSSILRRWTFILRSGASMLSLRFRSLSMTSKTVFFLTLISMPHHVVNSCTTSNKVCIPHGVSAKIESRR